MQSIFSVLVFGFLLGLKHAIEADHLAAVSTIVSERKSWLSGAFVGALWGVGHTVSLLLAGVAVILFRVEISERAELTLEFGVALMLIALGANALRKLRRGAILHFHAHRHGARWHTHPHMHSAGHAPTDAAPHATTDETHHNLRAGVRPLIVGMIHGMAGSAALMLLVLTTIESPLIAFAYIAVFGIGSIGSMVLMSALVGLPAQLTNRRWQGADLLMRGAAGLFSVAFGMFMFYEIGFVKGLFR